MSEKWDQALADLASVVAVVDPSAAVESALDAAADQVMAQTAQLRATLGQ